MVELVQSGAIGPVSEVRVWCNVKYGGVKRPTETPPVPKGLDWDLWLGPAPYRPYHPCYVPFKWRNWWDFGNGGLGDFGCHLMDLAFWALELRHPTTIEADGPPVDPESCALGLTVATSIPPGATCPPVKLTWYDGDKAERAGNPAGVEHSGQQHGRVVYWARRGCCGPTTTAERFTRRRSSRTSKPPRPTIPNSIGHHKEFFEACKTGGPTTCNFDYSGALTEAVLLGVVAYRVGEKLEWDAASLKATNCPQGDKYLRTPYREGWTL